MKPSPAELLRMIAQGESSHVAIAAELPDDDHVAQTLSAFGNTRGGWLLVGAEPGGDVVGLRDHQGALTRIQLVAGEDLKPALKIQLHRVRIEKTTMVAVHVNISDDRPHSVPTPGKGRADIFVRVGTTNEYADGATLNALRSHRTQGQPKDPLQAKILKWVAEREREGQDPEGGVSPVDFGKAANCGLRRANKAFIGLEKEGLLIGHGVRGHRFYALP